MSSPLKKPFLSSMRLYVLLTQAHCRAPLLEAARQVIAGGADVIQLREKDLPDREILALGAKLRRLTEDAGVGFILNDRPDLAVIMGADGVHLGQDDLPPAAARKVLRRGQAMGISTHSLPQARQAVKDGADYIGVGPVYPTETKGYKDGVGLEYVWAAAGAVKLPLVAIGGIQARNAAQVIAAAGPAHICIAVCGAVLRAADIEAATRALRETIDAALPGGENHAQP